MAARGRPVRSPIRQNIIEIMHFLKKGYGYQISKIYNQIFPTVTQRSIYYHLSKGVKTKEVVVHKIELEEGNFSWGSHAEKIYYTLGKEANPKGEIRVKQFLDKFKK